MREIGDEKKLSKFLNNIKVIVDGENKQREENGEAFNIFQITGKQSAEQHTHSAFIADLLNPNGSHKMGDAFRNLLFEVLDKNPRSAIFKTLEDSRLNDAKVFIEKKIGEVDNKEKEERINSTGGRLDILLELKNNYLTIENKIYAPELNEIESKIHLLIQ
jgi:hypothetical protein